LHFATLLIVLIVNVILGETASEKLL